MRIKGMDGQEHNVASSATGNAALTTGIIGTALGVLNGGNGNGLLGGLLGGNGNCNRWGNEPINVVTSDDRCISRYEAKMMQDLSAKDAKIGLLESQVYTDQKLVEVTKYVDGKVNDLAAEVRANKDAQCAVNMQQAVYNGTNTATIACIQNQVAQLASLSQLVVPSKNVCNTNCCCNG
jgi:hypothetical protein